MTTSATDIIKSVPTVADPALLRVQTIKRKFVEQMPRHEAKELPELTSQYDIEVVGTVPGFVILRLDNNQFHKVHRVDWIPHLIGKAADYKAALAEAHTAVNNYPQLFED